MLSQEERTIPFHTDLELFDLVIVEVLFLFALLAVLPFLQTRQCEIQTEHGSLRDLTEPHLSEEIFHFCYGIGRMENRVFIYVLFVIRRKVTQEYGLEDFLVRRQREALWRWEWEAHRVETLHVERFLLGRDEERFHCYTGRR